MNKNFKEWFETFLSEKGIDLEEAFEVEGEEWGMNHIPVGCVVEHVCENYNADMKEAFGLSLIIADFRGMDADGIRGMLKRIAEAIAV